MAKAMPTSCHLDNPNLSILWLFFNTFPETCNIFNYIYFFYYVFKNHVSLNTSF